MSNGISLTPVPDPDAQILINERPRSAIVVALDRASRKLEADLGGREEILANLVTSPGDARLDPFIDALADPDSQPLNLHQIAKKAGVNLHSMLHFYEQALKARAKLLAMSKVVERVAKVTENTMTLATTREKACKRCKGNGMVGPLGKKQEMEVCPKCNGEGIFEQEPSVQQQRLAHELSGAVGGQPAVVVNNQQQALTMHAGAGDLVQVQRAVHQLLSRGPLGGAAVSPDQSPAATPPVVDATVVTGEGEPS